MSDLKLLEKKAEELVALANKAGADHCDVVVASGESLSVSVREGKIENSDRSESDALYLRVFCGSKVANVSANRSDNAEALAERAVAMALVSPENPYDGLADQDRLFCAADIEKQTAALDLCDQLQPDAENLATQAQATEAAGLAVAGVQKSMGASAGWSMSGFVLATSDGFSGSYRRSGFFISTAMVAGTGADMERDYDFDSAVHHEDLKQPEEIGRCAAERVVRRLGPRQVKSASVPVIFEPRVSTGLLGAFAGAINGASVARKTSFLRERMHEKVAGTAITIVDDPLIARRGGSRPYDGEGVGTKKLNLVEDGVLREWLLDSATARELGLQTNGRASRGASGTSPTTTNCYMMPGDEAPEKLIAAVKDGLYVCETIGHGINMVTGDYSKGVSGFWIENGEIAYPVTEITIAGNLTQMFNRMKPASDLVFKYATNAPTLLVEGMTVGGK